MIGPHGLALRPDESFRIGLARALLRQPALLIIEEPAIEPGEDGSAAIDRAIDAAAEGRTLLLCPTRLSTLRSVTRVFVLRAGQLVTQGGHAELLQNSEFYRHLNYLRFNAFRDVL